MKQKEQLFHQARFYNFLQQKFNSQWVQWQNYAKLYQVIVFSKIPSNPYK